MARGNVAVGSHDVILLPGSFNVTYLFEVLNSSDLIAIHFKDEQAKIEICTAVLAGF